ncbi:MAG: hypothetical protein IKG15_06615 [Solobacterium sp.]|nr:hypothetical protein [Solobacterium sp.]
MKTLREEAFYLEDVETNRGMIAHQLEETMTVMDDPSCGIRENRLNELLMHAVTFSDFYKPYADYKSLYDFPVVNKTILKDHMEENTVSYLADRKDSVKRKTSGSTGTPFGVPWDHRKWSKAAADLKYFSYMAGAGFSGRIVQMVVLHNKLPLAQQIKTNVYYVYADYLDDENCLRMYKEIEELNPILLIGTAYILDALADYLVRHPELKTSIHLNGIVPTAQAVDEKTKKILREFYQAPVYCRYRCEEVGAIAIEDGTGNGYRLNEASLFVEILKMDSDVPAEEGEIGRVVITDFFSHAFPMIRYDIGDLASYKTVDGKMYLNELVGKANDLLYATDGTPTSPTMYRFFMYNYFTVKQYQIIQNTLKDFVMILNTTDHSLEADITEKMKEIFGDDMNLTFEYVDEIPNLRSGKTRISVCNIQF